MKIYINDISIIGSGIDNNNKVSILKEQKPWQYQTLSCLTINGLPSNESRRTTKLIKLAIHCLQSMNTPDNSALVFASSNGDIEITDKICTSLTKSPKFVSPTLFHNSVHNAPAGYYSIANNNKSPSTSISAGQTTFANGLLEAYTQVLAEKTKVLFVAYDTQTPQNIKKLQNIVYDLSLALSLSPKITEKTIASISLKIVKNKKNSLPKNHSLQKLINNNNIGDGLLLFESLLLKDNKKIFLPYNDKQLSINIDYA